MTKEGVYPSPINTRAHNNMNNEAVNETRLHPTWTKHCRMTIPSYTEQFWVPYVYRQWRLIPASESAIHKNNKAARLKSTKSWDSLNKSYCWQQAAPWVCACMYVNRLLDTFSQWEKVLAERIHTFVWNVYIAPQQRQTPVSSISWRWATMICPGCLSDFLCIWVREGVCVWLHIEWFMVMTQSWPKRTKVEKEAILLCVFLFHICSSKAFISGTCLVPFPYIFAIFNVLPVDSSCHPGILGSDPVLPCNVNILLLRTWTIHYNTVFLSMGKRKKWVVGG